MLPAKEASLLPKRRASFQRGEPTSQEPLLLFAEIAGRRPNPDEVEPNLTTHHLHCIEHYFQKLIIQKFNSSMRSCQGRMEERTLPGSDGSENIARVGWKRERCQGRMEERTLPGSDGRENVARAGWKRERFERCQPFSSTADVTAPVQFLKVFRFK